MKDIQMTCHRFDLIRAIGKAHMRQGNPSAFSGEKRTIQFIIMQSETYSYIFFFFLVMELLNEPQLL